MEDIFAKLFQLFSDYSYYIEKYNQIYWQFIWALIVLFWGFFTGVFNGLWRLIVQHAKRITGRDRYGNLYGRWKFYRIISEKGFNSVIDAEIHIKKSLFSEYPNAVFNTRHVPAVKNSRGNCKIVSGNVFLNFNSNNTGDAISRSPFMVSLVDGDDESATIKYGAFCGVSAADGDIYYGDCLISRRTLEESIVQSALSKTKKISRLDSKKVFRKSTEKRD